MFKNINHYLILEPHIDDFELGCLPFLLANAAPYKDEHSPVMLIEILTFCLGKNQNDFDIRSDARIKIKELLRQRGILVEWRNLPTKKRDTELHNGLINNHCEYINHYISTSISGNKWCFMFPQVDLHPDHNHVNRVGKILARRMFNKPVIEYIIWNSKDNPNIIPTNWNIEINLDENDKDILIDIRKIYKEDFDKLNNSNYNNKYNLIKYSL